MSKIKLTENKRVFFDPVSHNYLLDDDQILIGVTGLMKKHGLGADYSGIPEATLKKAAAEGTALHKEIEDYEAGVAVLVSPFIAQYQKLGLKCIANEYLVSDDETTASSIDGVYEGNGKNGVILVDYKFTQKVHKRPLAWQLGIYKVFFERQNPKLHVEGCYCLHGDKKKRTINALIPIEPVSTEEVDRLLEAERNGWVFIDEYEAPQAVAILSEEEISDVIAKAAKVDELKAATKVLEEALKGYYGKVRDYMVANNLEALQTAGGKFVLKKAYDRNDIDKDKLKRIAPELVEQCAKKTHIAASVSFKPDDKGQ